MLFRLVLVSWRRSSSIRNGTQLKSQSSPNKYPKIMLHPILFTFIFAIAVNLLYMADGFLFTKLLYKTGPYSSKLFHELHVDGSDEDLFNSLPNRRIGTIDDANNPSLSPEELVPLIMNSLKNNDTPDKDAGIKLVWEFSTDITKHIFKHNITGKWVQWRILPWLSDMRYEMYLY